MKNLLFPASISLVLAGCGGGGGGSDAPSTTKPSTPTPVEIPSSSDKTALLSTGKQVGELSRYTGTSSVTLYLSELSQEDLELTKKAYLTSKEKYGLNSGEDYATRVFAEMMRRSWEEKELPSGYSDTYIHDATGVTTWHDAGYTGKGVSLGLITDRNATNFTSSDMIPYLFTPTANEIAQTAIGPKGVSPNATMDTMTLISERAITSGDNPINIVSKLGEMLDKGINFVGFDDYGGIEKENTKTGKESLTFLMAAPDIGQTTSTVEEKAHQDVFKKVADNNGLVVLGLSENIDENKITSSYKQGYTDITQSSIKDNVLIVGYVGDYPLFKDIMTGTTGANANGSYNSKYKIAGLSLSVSNALGYAALMKERWNHLGGKEIVKILRETSDIKSYSINGKSVEMLTINMKSAFSPIGVTGVTTSSPLAKMNVSSAIISLPEVNTSKITATTSVYDQFNRDYTVNVSSFMTTETDTTFSQFMDYLNGFSYEMTKFGNTEVVSYLGKTESTVALSGQLSLVTGHSGKKSESSLSLPFLNDKQMFDNISQMNSYYYGLKSGDFLLKHKYMGTDVLGYTSAVSLSYQPSDVFVNVGVASGKMTNTLNGNSVDLEAGYKQDGFIVKGFMNQSNYEDTMLVNNFTTQKSGLIIGKTFDVNLLSDNDQLGVMVKHEFLQGNLGFTTTGALDADTGLVSTNLQKIGYANENQTLGLSYANENIKLLTVVDLDGQAPNNGIILSYHEKF